MAFPAHLLKKVDEMARQNYKTRSAYIRGVLAREIDSTAQKQDSFDQLLEKAMEATNDLDDS